MEDSQNGIAWNNLIISLIKMLDANSELVEAKNNFRSGGSGFESIKLKKYLLENGELDFKNNFDTYIFSLVNKKIIQM